ncbi:DsbA family protein [Gardnerella swidsinskii]|uniref:DsbA family protein n=1 Tax=Gardnerella swidsinskii TaxID=2792979 RepID=UPI000E2F6EBE|nr:thioredoxin domain-containing protein [Gardnerella swidsinskii]
MPKIQMRDNKQGDSSATRLQRTIENRERAAREARERRQQAIIGVIVVIIVAAMLAAVGITAYQAAYVQPQKKIEQSAKSNHNLDSIDPSIRPSGVNSKNGILFSKDGYGKQAAGAPTVATYFDPLCPGCGSFNRTVDETLIKMVEAGQINLELHPMSFLDGLSTDHYSTRVSSAIAYIASYDNNPKHLLQFINGIFNEKFQPEESEGYKPVSNKELIKLAKKSGIPNEIASKAFNRQYLKWQLLVNKYTPDRKELWNVSGPNKGSMTTPTVTINDKLLDMNAINEKKMKVLDALLHCIGLDKKQVGVAGQMPKVSDTSSPIAL